MKRFLLFFLSLLPLSAWAVTRTVTISAPSSIVTGQSFLVSTSVSTDAGGGEQIGFYHAEYSTNGGASWTGFCYDVNVGASATRNAYITAGAVGSTVQVRVRIAFRGGAAGDVDYNGSAINWGGSWDAWQTPPTKYTSTSVVAPPNQAPTITWSQNPANAYVNQWFAVQAHGSDADGNLNTVFVWKEWVPFAFNGGGNGYDNYSDANQTYGSAPGSINFEAQSSDSANATSAFIYHTITINNRAPYGPAISGSGAGVNLLPNGQYEMTVNTPITLTATLHDYDSNLAFHGIWHNNGTGITDGSTWQQLPDTGTPSNATDSTLVKQFTPTIPGRWDFHTNGHDGYLWAGGATITVYVYGPTNNSAFVSQVINGVTNPSSLTLNSGQTVSATITMSNTGDKPWTTDATPHRLGSFNPYDNTTWGLSRVALPASPINPQPQTPNSAAFAFNITAPNAPGTYQFQWQMVEDGVQWFGATTPLVTITVTDNIAPSTPTLQSTGSTTSTISLSWTASTDNSGTVSGYRIYRNGGTSPIATVTSGLTFTDTGLTSNTAYSYTVKSFDASNNVSGTSNTVTPSTTSDPNADNDGDGLPNGWEQTYFGSSTAADPNADPDNDGLTNIAEYNRGTSPILANPGTSTLGGSVPQNWPNTGATSSYVVGATRGSLQVDKSGGANYSIPFWTTPGTGGLQPEVSLNYSSNGGNGVAGFGWSFSGASAITRGPQTLKVDGHIHGVDLTGDDRFYLDGQRLILLPNTGAYGAAGSEYRTEIDTFIKVVAYGSAGSGPAYFKAWTKAGHIIEFGNTTDSAAEAPGQTEIMNWSANKISDHAGNYMNFTYSEDTTKGEQLLTQIDYTGNVGVTPYASVRFVYETRPDAFEGYYAGSKTAMTQRLKSISSYYGSTLARQFVLDYINRDIVGTDGLGRSILTTVHEKDGSGNEYPPLTFEYSNPANGWTALSTTWNPPAPLLNANITYDTSGHAIYHADATNNPPAGATFIDMDGDGWPDCVRTTGHMSNGAFALDVWLNKPGGWVWADGANGTPNYVLSGITALDTRNIRLADFNGDGLVDVITGEGIAFLNTGTGLVQSDPWSLPATAPTTTNYPSSAFTMWMGGRFVDLNGDGWLDYLATYEVIAYQDEDGQHTDYPTIALLNHGPSASQTKGSVWEYASQYDAAAAAQMTARGSQFLDLNGDKLPDGIGSFKDIERITTPPTVLSAGSAYLNSGNGFNYVMPSPYTPPTPFVINDGPFKFAYPTELVDLNGDGLTDIITRNYGLSDIGDTNGAWFNTGKTWTPAPTTFYAPIYLVQGSGSVTTGVVFLDLNNDGKVDFVRAFEGANEVRMGLPGGWSTSDSSTWHLPRPVFLSASDISNNLQGVTCKGAGSDMVDLNADGAVDQVWYWHQDYTWQHTSPQESKGAYVNKRVNPDRLTKVTNGFGDSSSITYAPLTERDSSGNSTVYTKGTDSTPGRPNVIAPMYVVKAIQESDGVGGQREKDYRYGGLRSDFFQGSLGFEWMRITDASTGIVSETTYAQVYPYIGMPISETVKSGSVTLTETLTNYDSKSLNSAANRFVFAKDSVTTTHDLNGAFVKEVDTSVVAADIDDYGNVTKSTTTTSGGFSKEVVSTYFGADTTNWFISQTSKIVSTAKATGTPDLVQTFTFTYEPATGLQKTVSVEPDTNTLAITTTYGYDQFGNKTSEEVKGKDLTVDNTGIYTAGTDISRTSTAKFQTNGRFPIWRKNALGHQQSFDSYNETLGVLTQATDANGLVSSWAYDSFGRKTQENHNVGITGSEVQSHIYYRWAPITAPAGSKYFVETTTDGAAPALAFFDTFGRIRHALSINGDGKIVYQSTAYDNLGRTIATSQPYFSGSSDIYWSGTASGQFDTLNRPLSVSTPDEEITGGIATTSFSYDGLTVTATNPNGHVLKTIKNGLGQVVQSIRNASALATATDYTKVLYAYDALGNLTGTDAAGITTTVDYDIRGRKTAQSDADMGDWSYRYNIFGELIWQKDAKGQITRMTYDDLGRLKTRVETEGTTTWTYDTAARTGGTWKGLPAGVTLTGGYNENYTYDSLGRSAKVSRTIDGSTYDVSQTYDAVGRPDITTYPTGFQTRNFYNGLGFLKEVRRADSNRNDLYWMADSFAVTGQVNGEILGNGLVNDRTYSPATGRLRVAAIGRGTETASPYSIQDLKYNYDPMANVLKRNDVTTNRQEIFTYDGLERMHTDALTGSVSSSLTMTYDQKGNITNKDDLGSYAYDYTPVGRTSVLPHAVHTAGSATYTYDANGNMLTGNGRTISWTSFNQVKRIDMTGGKFSEFSFGAAHERVKEVAHTGTTLYVGTLFEKVTGTNSVVENKHYIFTPTGRVAVRTERSNSTVDTKFFHTDGLGSITVVTSETGAVVKRFAFDAWGRRLDPATNQVVTSATSGGLSRGYTDHEQLDDLGLVHMNGRVYDPMLGRFLSADPTVQSVSDSQTYNRYSYCSNNPLNKTDPTGYTSEGSSGDSWWKKLWNFLTTPTPKDGGDDSNNNTGSGGNSGTTTRGSSQLQGSILIYSIDPSVINGASGVLVFVRSEKGATGQSKNVVVGVYVPKAVFEANPGLADQLRQKLASSSGPTTLNSSEPSMAWRFMNWAAGGKLEYNPRADTIGKGFTDPALKVIGKEAAIAVATDGTARVVGGVLRSFAGPIIDRLSLIIKCFPRGTKVETPAGKASIEDLKAGDLVLARDNDGKIVAREIVKLVRNATSHWVRIVTNGECIKATGSHPFWELTQGRWIHARDLRSGMILLGVNGTKSTIESVEKIDLNTPEETFNFEVAELHNYFAGTEKLTVLTHNVDPWEIAYSRDPKQISASDLFDHGPLAEKGWTLGDAVAEAETSGKLPSGLKLEGNWINDLSHPNGGYFQTANNRTLWVAQEAGLVDVGIADTDAAFRTIQAHLKMPSGGLFLRLCPY